MPSCPRTQHSTHFLYGYEKRGKSPMGETVKKYHTDRNFNPFFTFIQNKRSGWDLAY